MSSNFPPEYPNDDQATRGPAPTQRPAADNPYMKRVDQEGASELDEAAPTLTVNEVRQLNRKALFFLAGIVGLLLAMAFWFMNSLSNRDSDKKANNKPAQVIETPDLPQTAQVPAQVEPMAEPIDVVQNAPPLPPEPQSIPSEYRERPASDYGDESGQAMVAPVPRGPTLMERRMLNGQAPGATADPNDVGMTGMPGQVPVQPAQPQISKPKTSARLLNNPDALLVRGSYLRCVLETRIVTDVPGFTSCLVLEPVYSFNGRRLLFPKGTKLLGSYGNEGIGRGRVAVVWDRAVTPTGLDVTMASPGIDNLGGGGHPGQYDAHWPARISSALLISLVSDLFKYAGEKHGPQTMTAYPNSGVVINQPYQSNTAQTVQDLARQAIQDSANRKPTVTINQGSILSVYVSQDVDFTSVLRGAY